MCKKYFNTSKSHGDQVKTLMVISSKEKERAKKIKDNTRPVRQKTILRKLNPPPEPESESEPEVETAPSPLQSIEVTGPRSCRIKRCAFNGCPNSAPGNNGGITYFPFPRKPGQDSKWANRVSHANGEAFWPLLTSRVCQLHFPPELITIDNRGVPTLRKGTVPEAKPYQQGEIPNKGKVLLPNGDINQQKESLNSSEDLVINLEIDDKNPEVEQAMANLIVIPPLENEVKLQCVNVENKNATVHHLSLDKDKTANPTHVNMNKNNIATLYYVDCNNTLKCSNLNEDQISYYEALINPNITETRIMSFEIVPNQNDRENDSGIKSNSKLVGGKNVTPDEEIDGTIQSTESDNLHTDITVASEDCNSDGETEETVIGKADTSAGIQTRDDDVDETVVIVIDSDSDNG